MYDVGFGFLGKADDPAGFLDVILSGDSNQEQIELGQVLDQFDGRAIREFSVKDDHIRVPVADILNAEGNVAG